MSLVTSLISKTNWPTPAYANVSCIIGTKIYTTLGGTPTRGRATWEYDTVADTWTQKADYGGVASADGVGFATGGKFYAGLGSTLTAGVLSTDWYEYNPTENTWAQKNTPSFSARVYSSTFTYNDVGYVAFGAIDTYGTTTRYNSLWQYNALNDTWTQLASAESGTGYNSYARCATFVLGAFGYAVCGESNSGVGVSYVFKYSFAGNSWTRKADFPVQRIQSASAVFDSEAYVIAGYLNSNTPNADIYKYDAINDSWSLDSTLGFTLRIHSVVQDGNDLWLFGGFKDPNINNTLYTTKETSMPAPTITTVAPFGAIVASTTITITGTNYGATQDTSTVKIGATVETATAVTVVSWGATSITCKAGAGTPVTVQNVYVTVGTDTATATDAVNVLSADDYDTTEIKLGTMSKMYMNGLHVGYLQDNVEIQPSSENKDYVPNSSYMPVVTKVIRANCNLRFTISQINAKNIAIATNSKYTEATKTVEFRDTPVTLDGTPGISAYELFWTDASGTSYYFPNTQVTEPTNIVLNAQDFMSLPIAMRALPDTSGLVGRLISTV